MSDGYVLLQCTQCKAKMKYRGRRTEVSCKKCGVPISVQRTIQVVPAQGLPPEPVPVTDATTVPQELSYSVVSDLVLGLLLGFIGIVVMSYFKESIAKPGLLALVCVAVGLLAVQFYAFQLHRNVNFNKILPRLLGLPATLVLVLVGFFAVLELCVPFPEGICRRIIHGPPPIDDTVERQQRIAEEERITQHRLMREKEEMNAKLNERRKVWDEADCLLVNPGHKVIGLRIRNPRITPEYQVVAKVNENEQGEFEPSAIIKRAWERRMPIIAHDPQLARRVFNEFAELQVLAGEYYSSFKSYWQPARYVATRKPVVYTDANTRRKRYGISHGIDQNGLFFSELIPSRSEASPSSQGSIDGKSEAYLVERIDQSRHIQSGTSPQELLEHELREGADTLDYFLFSMLKKLQYQQQTAVSLYDMRAPSIYVDEASADDSYADQRIKDIRDKVSKFQTELKGQVERKIDFENTVLSSMAEKLSGVLTTASRELERQNIRSEIQELYKRELGELRTEVRQLELLLEQRKSLDGEIRSRLIRTNILLVERSNTFIRLAAREQLIRTQNSANLPVTQKGLSGAEALDAGMLDATHILLTSMRKPRGTGTYELSMRLVDARTGRIIWEDLGDRRFSDVMLTVPTETKAQTETDKKETKQPSPPPSKDEPIGRGGPTGRSSNSSTGSGRSGSSGNTQQAVNYAQTLPGTYTHSDPNGTRTITLMPNGELVDSNFAGSHSWAWRGRYLYMYWVIPAGRGRLPYQYTYVSVISEDGTSYAAGQAGNIVVHGTKE